MVHYAFDHRADREGLPANALDELVAEPVATTYYGAAFRPLRHFTKWSELTNEKVRVVHKLLIRGSMGTFTLFTSFNGSDTICIVYKNL